MKICRLLVIAAAGSLLFTGCKDISEIEPDAASTPKDQNGFPFKMAVTDSQGRSINAIVLAKKEHEIAIMKQSGSGKFIIPLARLSEADRQYFSTVQNGGNMEKIKQEMVWAAGQRTASRSRSAAPAVPSNRPPVGTDTALKHTPKPT